MWVKCKLSSWTWTQGLRLSICPYNSLLLPLTKFNALQGKIREHILAYSFCIFWTLCNICKEILYFWMKDMQRTMWFFFIAFFFPRGLSTWSLGLIAISSVHSVIPKVNLASGRCCPRHSIVVEFPSEFLPPLCFPLFLASVVYAPR